MANLSKRRRSELEALLASAKPPIHLTPATRDVSVAADWFRRFEGAGLDGVMAKPVSGIYEPDKRVMLKVKHERDCDCVVAGFRWHKKGEGTRSARCCWACSMMRARCSTSAFAPASRRRSAGSWWISSRPIARTRSSNHPWKRGRTQAGCEAGPAHAGRPEPLEPGQGSFVGAAAARVGGGSRL